jgi:hypothetical protein
MTLEQGVAEWLNPPPLLLSSFSSAAWRSHAASSLAQRGEFLAERHCAPLPRSQGATATSFTNAQLRAAFGLISNGNHSLKRTPGIVPAFPRSMTQTSKAIVPVWNYPET